MTSAANLRHIEALLKSRGWAIMRQTMEDEMLQAAMAIATSPQMTEKEVDFRRGAIWAARQLLEMPDKLQLRYANDIALNPTRDPTSE